MSTATISDPGRSDLGRMSLVLGVLEDNGQAWVIGPR